MEVSSPNDVHVATVTEVDCGATTDFATWAYVRRVHEPLNESDHIFVMGGRNPVGVEWQDDEHLVISHPDGEVFRKEATHDGVAISYVSP